MDIIIGHYYTNKKDMDIAQRISIVVQEYEEETGKNVDKVVIYTKDKNSQYKGVRYIGDANVRAFYTSWGIQGILSVVLGREITIDENKDEEYENYFNSQKWEYFDEDQVKIKDDTIHLFVI